MAKAKKAPAKARAKKSEKKSQKAAAKPPAAAGSVPGHNSDGLTDDQRCKLLLMGVAKLERLQGEMDTLKAEVRNARKALKADGFERFEVDFALQLRKSEDDAEEYDRWRRMQRIALFLNHPIGTQPDMFDGVDRTPLVERAYQDGRIVGMEGSGACNPPYDASTEAGQEWIRGWHDGQGVLIKQGITAPIHDGAQEQVDAFGDERQEEEGDTGASDEGQPEGPRKTFGEALREANPGIEDTPGFRPLNTTEEEAA